MQTRALPGTGLTVSRVCLGTMTFGSAVDAATAARMVDLCLDRGVTFFDTANVYNWGASETILGELLKARRSSVVLASKVGRKMGDAPDDAGLSGKAIRKAVEASLRRLQTDHLDIYYLHLPDRQVPADETLSAIEALVKEGKVRYPATSNHAAWQICRMLWLCDQRGLTPPLISQPSYNLLARAIEDEHAPFCEELGVSQIVYNPLAGGLLTDRREEQRTSKRFWRPELLAAADRLADVARRSGRSLVALALNWLLHHSAADGVILGAVNVEQLEQNLNAVDEGPLAPEVVAECDAVWQDLRGGVLKYNQ
ncbi:MAG TPA: aldo/keto reductase [Polyangia bacterium]|nr:aldo/keto reductase [Polyangia bacterium]